MRCIYCNDENGTRKHESYCPYSPGNIKKIGNWLKEYVESESRFNKNLKPFPSPKELDSFLRNNKIMRLKTIKRRYFDTTGLRLEDWLSELISIGLDNKYLLEEDFPIYVLYIWDTWLFKSKEEYESCYSMAIDIENKNMTINTKEMKLIPFTLKGSL